MIWNLKIDHFPEKSYLECRQIVDFVVSFGHSYISLSLSLSLSSFAL